MDVKGVLRKAVLPGGLAVAILAGCSLNKEGMGAKTMVTPQPMNSDTENELNADNAYRYSATVDETSTATTEEVTKEPTVQEENAVDKTQVSFEQLMNTMKENDLRRVVSEDAMKLVETFHNQTQKEGNFRLEEDGEVNLDLTYEEAFVLSTVVNYSDSQEMYDIFGDYNITSEKAKELFSSARKKIMIYYMNAIEPSGIKEIFHNENDRDFFGQIENDVLSFNKDHSVEKSDQIARDVYYDYILEKFL